MHLFLTSSPCDDNVPAGVHLPCILDARNRFVESLSACWKPDSRVVLVAASPDNAPLNDEMRDTFAGAFAYHGLTYTDFTLLDARNQDNAAHYILHSDAVILGGGHVPTQNAFFERIALRALLHRYPGVVMGISAGSMNCCREVYAQPEEPGEATDPDYRRFIRGLELTDTMVLPHYQMVRDNIIDGKHLFRDISIPDSRGGRTFYVLVDGSYVYESPEERLLCGESWRIHDGRMEKVCEEGQKIRLG